MTFIPKSVVGVQSIVDELFSSNNEILISLLPLDVATEPPSIDGQFSPGQELLQLI